MLQMPFYVLFTLSDKPTEKKLEELSILRKFSCYISSVTQTSELSVVSFTNFISVPMKISEFVNISYAVPRQFTYKLQVTLGGLRAYFTKLLEFPEFDIR
jgi:hypothetical protein